jgi:hypothetical protein
MAALSLKETDRVLLTISRQRPRECEATLDRTGYSLDRIYLGDLRS